MWVCTVCGFIYSAVENGGLSFEDLSLDWLCPDCGLSKDMFVFVKKNEL